MDGRDAMAMSSSYFIHRGIGGGSPNHVGPQSNLHGAAAAAAAAIRPHSHQNPSLASAAHVGGGSIGSGFQLESSTSPGGSSGVGPGEPVKRKRGRPRKYGTDGSVALALSPLSAANVGTMSISGSGTGSGAGAGAPRRGRGRPPGTGKKQQLASLGEWVAGSAGIGFTPHIITIAIGEDIEAKIMSFSQQGPRAICILSANGAVSTVTLRHSATSGGNITYEGRFEIICLSGSYLTTDDGGSRSRSGGLSISLASPDGRVIGGGVGGMLIAATPVQVIVGSFLHGGSKVKKSKPDQESNPEQELPMGDEQSPPTSEMMADQTFSSPVMGGWPGSRQMDTRNPHFDFDLTRG